MRPQNQLEYHPEKANTMSPTANKTHKSQKLNTENWKLNSIVGIFTENHHTKAKNMRLRPENWNKKLESFHWIYIQTSDDDNENCHENSGVGIPLISQLVVYAARDLWSFSIAFSALSLHSRDWTQNYHTTLECRALMLHKCVNQSTAESWQVGEN